MATLSWNVAPDTAALRVMVRKVFEAGSVVLSMESRGAIQPNRGSRDFCSVVVSPVLATSASSSPPEPAVLKRHRPVDTKPPASHTTPCPRRVRTRAGPAVRPNHGVTVALNTTGGRVWAQHTTHSGGVKPESYWHFMAGHRPAAIKRWRLVVTIAEGVAARHDLQLPSAVTIPSTPSPAPWRPWPPRPRSACARRAGTCRRGSCR